MLSRKLGLWASWKWLSFKRVINIVHIFYIYIVSIVHLGNHIDKVNWIMCVCVCLCACIYCTVCKSSRKVCNKEILLLTSTFFCLSLCICEITLEPNTFKASPEMSCEKFNTGIFAKCHTLIYLPMWNTSQSQGVCVRFCVGGFSGHNIRLESFAK